MSRPRPTDQSQPIKPMSFLPWATRWVVLVAFMDLFMQFPVIAPYARDLGASGKLVGVIVAAYSAANLVGNLIAGVILDRWGRTKPLLIGLVTTSLALLGYAFSGTPQQILIVRSLHGMTAAVLTPGSFAVLGDSVPAEERARAMGLSGAFIALAAVIGPFVAGVVSDRYGAQSIFLLSSALMLSAFFVFWYFSRNALREESQHVGNKPLQDFSGSETPFRQFPRLITAYVSVLTLTVGLGTLVTHLPVLLSERGEPAIRTGLTFTAFALVAMVVMASPLNRISDRIGRLIPIMTGLAWVLVGMLALWALKEFSTTMLGMSLFGLGFGILFPAVTALAAESVRLHQRGKAFGAFYAVFSVGVVIGSIASGLLTDRFSESTVLPFLVSAVVTLTALPAILFVWRLAKG